MPLIVEILCKLISKPFVALIAKLHKVILGFQECFIATMYMLLSFDN
jgi:hypothetical protein